MTQRIVTILLLVAAILFGPILAPQLLPMSTDIGIGIAVGLFVLSRPRWAIAVILVCSMLDEVRSVAPAGIHVVASLAGIGVATIAQRRFLSGHSQSQVAVLVLLTLAASRGVFALARGMNILFRTDWLLPTFSALTGSWVATGATLACLVFLLWPSVSRRWLSLQRISYWS
jgi:hypothetical protein